ncbi:SCAN domain-containing protein 3-like [Penaeus indicus]|uniref:SCAN domain-containing protein 3-like n=1 Tax=Penaeus indicus TaxID=29960 RepID=UPI00300D50F8
MKCNLRAKYANIIKEALALFKSYCITCQEKRKRNKTAGVVVKPLLSSEFNSRGEVGLVDMQSLPQAQFKWIMVYQCHLTKSAMLRALTSKTDGEVAFQLPDMFLLFGASAIRANGDIKDMLHAWKADKTHDWPSFCSTPTRSSFRHQAHSIQGTVWH